MAKTALVAGGAGFIGSHLCEALISLGMKVICVDNLGSGRKENIKLITENFKFIKRDIRKPLRISGKVDYVFHLASYASPPYYQKHSIETLMTNSLGTYNILELATAKKARFLITSTSETYGDPKEHPQKETYWGHVNPVGIRSCYDEAKRFSEALTMEYVRKRGLDCRIIRIFNTYGPRLQKDDGRVISNFIDQALNGRPMTIYGDGSQTRSFCYVSDMVRGLILAMLKPGIKGEVINLGNPDEFTVKEAALIIKRMTRSKSRIVRKPLPKDDPCRRKPDISKAKKLLGWQPQVKLVPGLMQTIKWFENGYRKG
ncbi:MAG TPA: SDR family oxidoreductase [Candidatus Goldiibacteriota bacterium]|nr:SDR family oxidoreductase [Candidatus Goldiibacteriota bacterium]